MISAAFETIVSGCVDTIEAIAFVRAWLIPGVGDDAQFAHARPETVTALDDVLRPGRVVCTCKSS